MFFKRTAELIEHGNVRGLNVKNYFQQIRLNVYCYEVDGLLIDTGAHALFKYFKPFLDQADVDKTVITHFHEDHTGCAFYMEEKGIAIYMNELSLEDCQKKADYPFYRKLFWGVRPAFQAYAIGKTINSRNALWDVIMTPGHAKDHLCYLNQQTGQLFSGDLFVATKTKLVLREESVPSIIRSIEKVLTYDFEEMFCCHAGYVANGREQLLSKLQYLQHIEGQVLHLQQKGYSVEEIQRQLFSKKYPITKVSSGEWDSKHIITSILKESVPFK